MAIAHLHATVVQRSAGQSAVGAAAYAARARILDERTGVVHDYSRKNADVMFSFVGLPKDAPDRLLDPSVFANALEAREGRKNSQTARKFVMALPHELTDEQREWLVKDFGRENFNRKGLAYHVAIHRPHEYGDQRNIHAHWTVSTRVLDRSGFTEKYREGTFTERQAALLALRDNWEQLVNRHLERHGHKARISMKSLEAQGIDRMPQIHLGQGAAALERKGNATEIGDRLRGIANDNVPELEREAATAAAAEQVVDRDEENAAWQDSVDKAGIAYAEERRQQFMEALAADRAAFERQVEAMTARHAATWVEIGQRHHAESASLSDVAVSSYQPGTMAEAEEAANAGLSFLLGLFTSWAESFTRSVSGTKAQVQPKRQRAPDKTKQHEAARRADQQREAHSRELEAMMQEQAREREQYERRRAQMLFQQAGAMQHFEQQIGDKSSIREAFEKHTERVEGYKAYQAEKAERSASREGRDRDGPELGL